MTGARLRSWRALLCAAAALSQLGCGFYWSGRDQWEHARREIVRPAESDASLECNNVRCAGVTVERTEYQGHFHGTYWAVTGVEFAGFAVPLLAGRDDKGTVKTWAAAILIPSFLLFAGDLVLGGIGYVGGAMGRSESDWKTNEQLQADWRGARVPLNLIDVVPRGTSELPATFSVAKAAERRGVIFRQPDEERPAQKLAKAGTGSLAVLRLRQAGSAIPPGEVTRLTESIRLTMVGTTGYEILGADALASRCGSGCDDASDLDIGVKVGAGLVLASNALRQGQKTTVTLRLTEVASGNEVARQKVVAGSEAELDQQLRAATVQLAAQATGTPAAELAAQAKGTPVAELAARAEARPAEKRRVRVGVPDFVAKGSGFTPSDLGQLTAAAMSVLTSEGTEQGVTGVPGSAEAEVTLTGEVLKFGSTLRATVRFSGAPEGEQQAAAGKTIDELRESVKQAVRGLIARGLPAGVSR